MTVHGAEEAGAKFDADHDDYSKIMVHALADRCVPEGWCTEGDTWHGCGCVLWMWMRGVAWVYSLVVAMERSLGVR